MIDDVDYSDDLDVSEDDISTYDTIDNASFIETSCLQDDCSFVDLSSAINSFSNDAVNSADIGMCNMDTDGLGCFYDELPNSFFGFVHNNYGANITDGEIVQSAQQTIDFFHLSSPKEIWEEGEKAVINEIPVDDHIFNRRQLCEIGISDKGNFDLIMTQQGAHRALQRMDLDFNERQEELCCDYITGVRAGVNGIKEGSFSSSIADAMERDFSDDDAMRVQAVEEGVAFANDYIEQNGTLPSFTDCLESFRQSNSYVQSSYSSIEQVDFHPETLGINSEIPIEDAVAGDSSVTPHSDSLNSNEPTNTNVQNQLSSYGYASQISFGGYQEDVRDAAASSLQDKLNTYRIYYPGSLSSSELWGGWDKYTGEKIRRAIQEARNNERISDSVYNELISDLKKACYYES